MVARKPKRETPRDPESTDDIAGEIPERTPDALPVLYLDETGPVPVIGEAERGPRVIDAEPIPVGGKTGYYAVIREINPVTSAMRFAVAVKVDPGNRHAEAGRNGKALRYLIKRGPKPVIIWVGSIEVIRKYRAYRITDERTLEKIESSRTITVRVVNGYGVTTTANIALMNMRASGDKAQWIDDLDLHGSSQTNMIKTAIIAMAESREDDCIVIHGQGPVYLTDNRLAFAAQSVVYDDAGNALNDVRVDINAAIKKPYLRYYDVTPVKTTLETGEEFTVITNDQVLAGIAELRLALTESPEYPEIPAAFTGQMYTSPLATIHRELWSGLHLSGVKGSGKTYYAVRWDAVQSRKMWKSLGDIRPALAFGDTTGTVKGQQYRSTAFGGYAITTDDVIKSGDTDYRIREQAEKVQNLTRSFETGGSARAMVDRRINDTTDGNAPELSSCLKITSEKPVPGDSLQNRLIMLPHITQTWGRGGYFSREIAQHLSTPESRELQHRAWSAYVHWLISHAHVIPAHLASAREKTESWGLGDARQASRYAVLVAGHAMFREFAATHGVDYSDDAASAVAALRVCASRQAGNSTPLADRFAEALRLEIVRGHLSYPGPPVYDPDGDQVDRYSPAGIITAGDPGEDGIAEHKRDLGGFTYDELGLVLGGSTKVAHPPTNITPLGYLVPPRTDTGGKSGDPLTRRWLIAHKPTQFAALCEQLTRASRDRGWVFDRAEVIKSLRDTGTGNNDRMYLGIHTVDESGKSKRKQERCVYIDAEFALKTPSEVE